ncbi:MAG: type II toxin-antitoxin system Phd/YefM family antitoxin [Rubrivivax sp.]
MNRWSVRNAKARFGELLDVCIAEGPQLIIRRRVEVAVLVSMNEWRRLQPGAHPSLKQLLLTDVARCSPVVPSRGRARRRVPVAAS